MEVSCLQFVPYNPDEHVDFITVRSGSGCSSAIGRRGNEQFIELAPNDIETGCFRLYTIAHEFLHALGFFHMQAAHDRDNYIRVVRENIQPGAEGNFARNANGVDTHYGVEYDYGSVMHFSAYEFSENGLPTITALRPLNGQVMGQRERLSDSDIERLNIRYSCNLVETTVEPTTAEPTTVPLTTIEPTTAPQTTAAPTTAPQTTAASTTAPQTTATATPAPTTIPWTTITTQRPIATTDNANSTRRPLANIPIAIRTINAWVNSMISNIFNGLSP